MSRRHYNTMVNPGGIPHPYSRCFEAAELLDRGFTVAEAADKMGVSEKTVEYHVANFFLKANLKPGKVNLAHWFIAHDFIRAEPKYRHEQTNSRNGLHSSSSPFVGDKATHPKAEADRQAACGNDSSGSPSRQQSLFNNPSGP